MPLDGASPLRVRSRRARHRPTTTEGGRWILAGSIAGRRRSTGPPGATRSNCWPRVWSPVRWRASARVAALRRYPPRIVERTGTTATPTAIVATITNATTTTSAKRKITTTITAARMAIIVITTATVATNSIARTTNARKRTTTITTAVKTEITATRTTTAAI